MRNRLIKRMDEFLSCRLAEEHPHGRLRQHVERPAITISREAGTRGLEIGMKLVDYLDQFDDTAEHGWALFDQSLLARVIEERRLPDVVPDFPNPFSATEPPLKAVEDLQGTRPADWTLREHTIHSIRRLSRLGNAVILGRGANFITRDLPNVFHVRLVSSRQERLTEVQQSLGLSDEEAAAWVESTDRAREAYVRRHLGARIDDPAAYHLTIHAGRLEEDRTARLIGDAVMDWFCSRCLTATL